MTSSVKQPSSIYVDQVSTLYQPDIKIVWSDTSALMSACNFTYDVNISTTNNFYGFFTGAPGANCAAGTRISLNGAYQGSFTVTFFSYVESTNASSNIFQSTTTNTVTFFHQLKNKWCFNVIVGNVENGIITYNMYVNGKKTNTTSQTISSMPNLVIGGTLTSNVKYYKYVMSDEEVYKLSVAALKDNIYGLTPNLTILTL